MKRRLLLVAAVLLLVVMNVAHWWPAAKQTSPIAARKAETGVFQAADFEIRGVRPAADAGKPGVTRDLFRIKQPVQVVRKGPPPPPPKTPEQLAREAAERDLTRLRLIAVVAHGRDFEAFMSDGGDNQVVRPGARIGPRFIVEQISTEAVRVSDPETSVSGTVGLTGK